MASVIIHEFEVEAQPESPSAPSDTPAEAPLPAAHDVELTIRRQMERALRVWAH
jgi:hypothetical protein